IAFTLAHELLHAIEHLPRLAGASFSREWARTPCHADHSGGGGGLGVGARRRLQTSEDWAEFQANGYAAALLMPAFAVRREFANRFEAEFLAVGASVGSHEFSRACL